ncbi:MAG: hypothetical protein NVSMB52_06140 [Chloroflexota bacterium]
MTGGSRPEQSHSRTGPSHLRGKATRPQWLAIGFTALAGLFVAGIVLAISLRAMHSPSRTSVPSASGSLSKVIDGIPCNAEDVTYHEHAHLTILAKGHEMVVPARVGQVDNTCLYSLHTHDTSGEIHMEAPRARTFTLGNFFDVWNQPLTRNRVAETTLYVGQTIKTYVNGRPFAGDPRTIILRRHSLITVEIGPPFTAPRTFDFQGD